MDPNAALNELRELAAECLRNADTRDPNAVRVAELIEGLDGWLHGGGFLPARWERKGAGL